MYWSLPFLFWPVSGIFQNIREQRKRERRKSERGREQGRKKVKGGSRAKSPGCDKKFILDKGQIIIRDV